EGSPVSRLEPTSSGLWVGTRQGLYLLRVDGHSIERFDNELGHARIEHLFEDRSGNLWIGTPTILWRRRPNGIVERVSEEDLTPRAYIDSAFEDREGNLWLGSRTEGIFRLWDGWAVRLGAGEGLKDAVVWSTTRDPQGRIVLGSNSNVSRLDADGVHEIVSSDQLGNQVAYELSYDSAGRLWIGMRAGLALFDHGRIATPSVFSRLNNAQVNAIVQRGDDVWIGSQAGLFRYHGEKLEHIPAAPGVVDAPVRNIHFDEDGTLIVSTDGGVRQLDGGALGIPPWARPLEGDFVMVTSTIVPGLYGIGTRSAGLSLLRDGHLLRLDERNGLPR